MHYKILSQLILLIISIAVFVTYIQPTFSKLQLVEQEISQFKEAVSKASQFNQLLNSLTNTLNTITQTDLQILEKYLPNTIDSVLVAKDLETLIEKNGLFPKTIGIEDLIRDSDSTVKKIQFDNNDNFVEESTITKLQNEVTAQSFKVSIQGSYESFKMFLRDVEVNAYPLRVSELTVVLPVANEKGGPSDIYTFDVTFETYAFVMKK